MTIQVFATDVSRWDIFLSTSLSFSAVSSRIHEFVIKADTAVRELRIYVGMGCYIHGLEIVENFEILLNFTPIDCIHIVLDNLSCQLVSVDGAVRFMREVFDYNVHLTIVEADLIYHPSDDEI
jgi:hypothetical protein